MKYAIIGDIHSSVEDLLAVLRHIQEVEPNAEKISTGDLFECIIGKKRAQKEVFDAIEDVLIEPEKIMPLLTFPTVYGNQEERIVAICKVDHPIIHFVSMLPQKLYIQGASVTHGHEWDWSGEPWTPQITENEEKLFFFGHSHTSSLFLNGVRSAFQFDEIIHLSSAHTGVNVGSVVTNREWVLYDSEERTIEFKKTAD
ncbi:metallophosphoesterase family protein [Psychrobacillus sp.]|uniref:metallophosphoesterase family protein n=1 Tax=Psychrobacillus sp. TaxID=1871623 RepID=UPI0028BF11F2|nr:metallophosphoesterase family protein [Psychrobacillus sp.]